MTEEIIKETNEETKEITKTESVANQNNNKFKTSRMLAFLIDCAIGIGLVIIVGGSKIGILLAAAYWLLRDGMEFSFMNKRSIGKKLMKLKIETTDGSEIDYLASAKRNWTFALAYLPSLGFGGIFSLIGFILFIVEAVMVLTDGKRIGDKSANTIVVEA